MAPFSLWHYRAIFKQMLKRSISQRYKGSMLGLVWSFVQPLLMLCVYTFVFGVIFKSRWGIQTQANSDTAFPLIMFCGMAVFNLFSDSVNTCGVVVFSNANLVKKVSFPLELLPLVSVGTSIFYNAAWFLLLFAGGALWLGSLSWTMLLLPLTMIPVALISAGVSLAVAAFSVYLRDIPQFVAVFTQILFFMTPIFYPVELVPQQYTWLLKINPLTPLVEQTRLLFLFQRQPDYSLCLILFLFSIAIFYLGYAVFMKLKKGFADVL